MEKLAFALKAENEWPPVAVEHLWCEKTGLVYELKNAPFFLQGLAFGDRFTAEPDSVNGYVFEFELVNPSGHSLVWVLDKEGLRLDQYQSDLIDLGCNIEGFTRFNLHAIDVPPSVSAESASAAMDKLEGLGFSMAFPVWRHEC